MLSLSVEMALFKIRRNIGNRRNDILEFSGMSVFGLFLYYVCISNVLDEYYVMSCDNYVHAVRLWLFDLMCCHVNKRMIMILQ